MDNTLLVVIGVLLTALILGIGLPFIYMSGRLHMDKAIDKAMDDTRVKLLTDATDWMNTQRQTIMRQTEQIQMLQQDLRIERDSRMRLEGQLKNLEAQLQQQQNASDVYRATLVVLLLQMQQHNIRPKINSGLLDVVRKDGKAGQLLKLVEDYLNGE